MKTWLIPVIARWRFLYNGIAMSLLLLHTAGCCFAQNTSPAVIKNEVYAGYGRASFADVMLEFSGAITIMFYAPPDIQSSGIFQAGYNRFLSDHISLGGEVSFEAITLIGTDPEAYENHYTVTNITARFDYRYWQRENMAVYSGLSIGVGNVGSHGTINPAGTVSAGLIPAGQLNLFGISYGKKWNGFVEFGFGSNGIINMGLTRRF